MGTASPLKIRFRIAEHVRLPHRAHLIERHSTGAGCLCAILDGLAGQPAGVRDCRVLAEYVEAPANRSEHAPLRGLTRYVEPRAPVQINIAIMLAFVKLRGVMATHKNLARLLLRSARRQTRRRHSSDFGLSRSSWSPPVSPKVPKGFSVPNEPKQPK